MIKVLLFFLSLITFGTEVQSTLTEPVLEELVEPNTVPLDVMTYNIRTGNGRDGDDAWPQRKPRTISLLQKYSPDIIGLQEALTGQLTDLEQALPDYVSVGAGRLDGRDASEFVAILYKPARLRLLRSDTFWLSDTPREPGSTHWGNRIPRICTWAHFQDRETGRFFYVFNTHLDHLSQPSRVRSAELIIERMQNIIPHDPMLLMGDLNAGEDNPVIETMQNDAGFRDSFRVIHPDESVVGTTNGFSENRNQAKIDYVFVDKNWKVEGAAIIDDKVNGRWPSDHLPVTARIVLE